MSEVRTMTVSGQSLGNPPQTIVPAVRTHLLVSIGLITVLPAQVFARDCQSLLF